MKETLLLGSIETVLKRAFPRHTVRDFSLKPGSADGDNYMGIMYAITVELEGEEGGGPETKHVLLKASSANEARREFADDLQVFNKEVAFYKEVIPELFRFQKVSKDQLIEPAFVKCYDATSPYDTNNRKCDGSAACLHCQPPLPWDYVLMQDMREEGGYRMGNRFTGLDSDHSDLVLRELAKYHALGYAYIKGLSSDTELFDRFPSLKETMISRANEAKMEEIYLGGSESTLNILAKRFPRDSFEFQQLKRLVGASLRVASHFVAGSSDLSLSEMASTPVDLGDVNLRDRERKRRNQWLVLSHGDSWVNNFLFKYAGERPSGVKLVDLQAVREICLTTDISYFLYMSTTAELRKNHLNTLLSNYYETFSEVCRRLKVEPWPDFTLDNLKMKYLKSVLFGASAALSFLPIILLPKDSAVDMEREASDESMFGAVFAKAAVQNENLDNRIISTALELLAAGVLD